MTGSWQHFEHGADIGVRGLGVTMAEAFEQTALALTAVVTDPGRVVARETVLIRCEDANPELLLVDWLNEIVFEMATRQMLFGRYEVTINRGRLQGRAQGERVDVDRHGPAVEVKGATLTELAVHQTADGWTAQCVVDV